MKKKLGKSGTKGGKGTEKERGEGRPRASAGQLHYEKIKHTDCREVRFRKRGKSNARGGGTKNVQRPIPQE